MRSRTLRIASCARHFGVLAVLCCAASLASAQWAWRDEHGRTVYSDQPPPASVRATDVLRQPTPQPPNQSSDSSNADAPSASNPAGAPSPSNRAAAAPRPPTMAERELDFRKRMKERAEADKKLADSQAEAARKADDCERARGYLRSLDDGARLVRTNPDGSRELVDDAQRAAEVQRTQQIIQSRCN